MKNIQKTFKLVILFIFVTLLMNTRVDAQWKQTNGPYSGKIRSLVADDSNLFAGSDSGIVYHSTDGGASWRRTYVGDPITSITALCKIDDIVVAACGKRLISTSDNGKSWSKSFTFPLYNISRLVAIDSTLFVVANTKLYRSTNKGKSWVTLLDSLVFLDLAADNKKLCVVTNDDVVLTSDDLGVTWVDLGDPGGGPVLQLIPSQNWVQVIIQDYSAHPKLLVAKYNYNGNFWQVFNTYLEEDVVSHTYFNSTQYIGTRKGNIYKGALGSWVKVPFRESSSVKNTPVTTLLGTGNRLYCGAEYGGIQWTTKEGTYWKQSAFGNHAYYIAQNDSDVYSFTGCLLRYQNDSIWTQIDTSSEIPPINSVRLKGDTLYIGTSTGMFTSTDKGKNWRSILTEFKDSSIIIQTITDSFIIFRTPSHLYRSEINKNSWEYAESGLPDSMITDQYYKVVWCDSLQVTLFATSQELYASTDRGKTWNSIGDNPLGLYYTRAMAVQGDYIFLAGSYNVFRSNNLGSTWLPMPLILNGTAEQVSSNSSDVLVAFRDNLFRSSDHGESWYDFSEGLPKHSMYSGAANANGALSLNSTKSYLYIGGEGIWVRSLSDAPASTPSANSYKTDIVRLLRNYPNPFTTSTAISYILPKRDMVTIEVFDVLGRKIQTLANDIMDAGPHSVVFNGENLPSGMYTLKITAGALSEEMKVLLNK